MYSRKRHRVLMLSPESRLKHALLRRFERHIRQESLERLVPCSDPLEANSGQEPACGSRRISLLTGDRNIHEFLQDLDRGYLSGFNSLSISIRLTRSSDSSGCSCRPRGLPSSRLSARLSSRRSSARSRASITEPYASSPGRRDCARCAGMR